MSRIDINTVTNNIPVPYAPIPAWYSMSAVMELDTSDTLSVHRQAALAVEFRERGRIYNTGFCGIPQKKGTSYHFSMFAKTKMHLTLVVAVKEGEVILSSCEFTISSDTYTLYQDVLTAGGDTNNAIVEIYCPKGGAVKFGYISFMPEDNYLGNGWYPNLIRFNNSIGYGIPSDHVWKLFTNHGDEQIVETTVKTDRIYRPVKGMASLMGAEDLVYRGAVWNGRKAKVSHELMGRVEEISGIFTVRRTDEKIRDECSKYHVVNPEEIFIVFGEEEDTLGTFEIEIKAERDREIVIGIFSSCIPKEVDVSDKTHSPKEWNVEKVRPFLWKLNNGRSRLEEQDYPSNVILDSEKQVQLNQDEFNCFRYTTDGKKLFLYINGQQVHEIELPSFPTLHAVVSNSDQEVIIKLVNMAEQEDGVTIKLNCDVADEYKSYILTGDKMIENSFENPIDVNNVEHVRKGAAKKFIYQAPPLSVNVLRLVKKV